MAKTNNNPSEKKLLSPFNWHQFYQEFCQAAGHKSQIQLLPSLSLIDLFFLRWPEVPFQHFPLPQYPIQCRGVHAQHIQYQNPTGNDFDHILRLKKYLYALISFLLFILQLVHWFDFIPCRGSSKWRYIKVTLLGQKIQDQVMRPSVWSFLSHSQSCPSLASWIC